jgi:hypothetical protein
MQSSAKGAPQVDILTIVAVLPFVAVCIVAAFLEAEQARTSALNDALARARTTMSAVDFELRGHVLTVQAMATSRSFEKGDLRAIYDESKRILGSQPAWLNVGLQSGNGTQLFNAIEPFGTLPAPQADQESLERALELGTPQIGNVAVGPAIDKAATRVRVPVHAQGKVRYVISVPLKPQLFEDILRSQQLPPDWEISLLDGKGRLVASVPPRPAGEVLGKPAPAARRKVVPLAPEGMSQLPRADGVEVYASYVKSNFSGWQVSVLVPKESIEAVAWNGARPIVLGVMAALSIAAFMLWLSIWRSDRRKE